MQSLEEKAYQVGEIADKLWEEGKDNYIVFFELVEEKKALAEKVKEVNGKMTALEAALHEGVYNFA